MAGTKGSSSQSIREPFGPVTELIQVPVALFEILGLATEGNSQRVVTLMKDVIKVTLADPEAWQKIGALRPPQ
jgi:hypothetical protein